MINRGPHTKTKSDPQRRQRRDDNARISLDGGSREGRNHERHGAGRSCEELGVEIALDAAAPSADEAEVESTADGGAGERDEARDPFLGGFGADTNGKALHNHRSELFDELLFGKVLAEIDSRGGRGGEPEFALLFVIAEIESIEQAETLNQTQCDDGEQACVGNKRDHTAEAEAGTFEEGEALRVANQSSGNGVQLFDGIEAQLAEIRDINLVFRSEVAAKGFAIDFDRAHAAAEAEAEEARETGSKAHAV